MPVVIKPKLLLHACCAACSIHVAEMLKKEYEVTLHFHNPQICPQEEYEKRILEVYRVGEMLGLEVIEEISNTHSDWLKAVKGLENEPEGGKRCAKCFEFNLEATASFAKYYGFDAFATTLTVSPHKNATLINEIGRRFGKKYGIKFIEADFKKNDGFLKSCEKCNEHDIYRQDYCGCEFSLNKSIASPKE